MVDRVVAEKSPPLSPSPVKSNRSTAKPAPARPRASRDMMLRSLEQVKQCTTSRLPRTPVSGSVGCGGWNTAASGSPVTPTNRKRSIMFDTRVAATLESVLHHADNTDRLKFPDDGLYASGPSRSRPDRKEDHAPASES